MLRIHFVLLLVATVLYAAPPLEAADIEGLIRSGVQTSPLSSATVQLRRGEQGGTLAEQLVGSSGRFEFRNLNLGTYVIRVHADGFADREETVLITKVTSKEVIQLELQPKETPPKNRSVNARGNGGDGRGGVVSVYDLKVPDSARHEYEQGLKERDRKGCSKAMPHFEKAIDAFGKYADALNEIGKCYRQTANFERAEDAFRNAIQYGSSIFPYVNLADLFVSRKQFEDSQKILHDGIAKFPDEGDLYFALSNSFFGQGRMKEAEGAGLAAHARYHASADVHLLLAKIYAAVGKHPDAIAQLKTYLTESPKGPVADRVRNNLAQLERE